MKKDEEKLWDAFFACGLYLYLEKNGELDEEKLWHETPEETERHWQQVVSEPESGITLKETVRVEPVILLCMCQK